MGNDNRYAKDWNSYSKTWEGQFSQKYRNLGDEWNDDGTAERKRDEYYFQIYADRFLTPDMTVLEVGPGGGKWSVRLAKKVKKLIVLDVAEEMLGRTRKRLESEGIKNVEFLLANGKDFAQIPDESIDFFFSYDVFVHIALEDTFLYTKEIARVLKTYSTGLCHYAINSVPNAWMRIEHTNEWFRRRPNSAGQFYYFSPESLTRMYEHFGLFVQEYHVEWCMCVLVFNKLAVLPKVESLLHLLISEESDDARYRASVVGEFKKSLSTLEKTVAGILDEANREKDASRRLEYASRIRRLMRGI